MDITQYQEFTSTTNIAGDAIARAISDDRMNEHTALHFSYLTLGLTSEAGEVASKIKKIIRDKGCEISADDRLALSHELGDCLWYISELANLLDIPLTTILRLNADKLTSRQARGKLTGSGDTR